MTIIYAFKKDWEAVKDQLDLEFDHVFANPHGANVDYTADRVLIVGNHPTIEAKYAGIVPVETITLDEDE